jgi:hypothetical protein
MKIVCTFSDVAVPAAKQAKMNMGIKTEILRPYSSLAGAKRRGPGIYPATNREMPRTATSRDIPYSSAMYGSAGESAELANVEHIVVIPSSIVMTTCRMSDVSINLDIRWKVTRFMTICPVFGIIWII